LAAKLHQTLQKGSLIVLQIICGSRFSMRAQTPTQEPNAASRTSINSLPAQCDSPNVDELLGEVAEVLATVPMGEDFDGLSADDECSEGEDAVASDEGGVHADMDDRSASSISELPE
jgi:hypothetical protein